MGFDINKINQLAMEKQQNSKTEEKQLEQGINTLISQCISFINTEEFEDILQQIIESNIKEEYNPRNSKENIFEMPYWFDFGIYNSDGIETNLFISLLIGTVGGGGYCIDKKLLLPVTTKPILYMEKYNKQKMLDKVNELQDELVEKFIKLKLKCIKAVQFTDGTNNSDLIQNYLGDGKICINWE
jgi:hypothetical protein